MTRLNSEKYQDNPLITLRDSVDGLVRMECECC